MCTSLLLCCNAALFLVLNVVKSILCNHLLSIITRFKCFMTAIATIVTIVEILKNNGLAIKKEIMTSTIYMREESYGRPVQKAKVHFIIEECLIFNMSKE